MPYQNGLNITFAFIVALIISYAATPLVKRLAFKIGAVDVPKDKRRMRAMEVVGGENAENCANDPDFDDIPEEEIL